MKCQCCGAYAPDLGRIREPSIAELAQNDVKLGNKNFSFELGDLDFYFLEHNKVRVPSALLVRLREIKEAQGI